MEIYVNQDLMLVIKRSRSRPALYPKEYATDLQSRIDLDFNYRTNQAGDDEKTQQSFLDMIFESLSKNRKSTATEAQTEEQPTE